MLLEKKIKILQYINSNDTSVADLGTKLLENNLSPENYVWFYLKLSTDIRKILFKETTDSKSLHKYVKKHYKEMDDDSKKIFWEWVIFVHANDIIKDKEVNLDKIYAYFK